jgi:cobaltochelatase CobN
VAWLKAEWRTRRLNPRVQLTIAECLGPCDLVNVVAVFSEASPIWLGGLVTDDSFHALLEWAAASREAGGLLPLPLALQPHRFERFTSPSLTPEPTQ